MGVAVEGPETHCSPHPSGARRRLPTAGQGENCTSEHDRGSALMDTRTDFRSADMRLLLQLVRGKKLGGFIRGTFW